MNFGNGNMVFRGKGNHSSLTDNGVLQDLHTTNLCVVLMYEDLRFCATQLLTGLISHHDPHGSLLL